MTRPASSDPFFEKGLPSNVEAERSILGAILLDNTVCNQAIELLRREDFFLDSHRRIFDKMVALTERGSPIDLITLSDELRRAAEFEQIGGATYIASLIDGVPRTDTIEHYAKIVKSKAQLRKLITASNQIIANCFDEEDDPDVIIDRAEAMIFQIAEDRVRQGFQYIGEVAQRRLEQIEQMAGRPEMITGVPTGFTDFDQMTSGLQRQDLIIIAARPSMGKTALALNMAQYAAKNGNTVGVFSLEMSAEQLVSRLLCSEARVDAHRLRTGYLNREEWARLADALRRLCETQVFIDDTPGTNVLEMRAKSRRLKAEHGLDMLIIDYLQLMSGRGRIESRQQEVSQISRDLKGLAKELDIPVIALSQLSRATETRSDHRPQLSDLRESGCIAGNSLVPMADTGAEVPIRDLVGQSGFAVWALNEETLKIERAVASRAFSTGIKPVYRLITRLGRCIRATGNHKFRTFEGWKRLDELRVGERLAVPRELNSSEQEAGVTTRQMMASIQTAYCGTQIYKQNVSRERAARIATAVSSDYLSKLSRSDIYWDQIISIEADGEDEVYDLTVPGQHNFITDCIIAHNSIEQDADVVCFIYREEVYNQSDENRGTAELIIGKQRNGPTGTAQLAFLKEFTRFENMWRE